MFNSVWYDNLIRPTFTPPAWVFTPAWIILYLLILISLVLYTRKSFRGEKVKGYIFFIIQLLLNLAWSPVFFILQNPNLALVVIILMDLFVILTIKEFFKVSKISAYLLFPYLIWIIFATYLNVGFCMLNKF